MNGTTSVKGSIDGISDNIVTNTFSNKVSELMQGISDRVVGFKKSEGIFDIKIPGTKEVYPVIRIDQEKNTYVLKLPNGTITTVNYVPETGDPLVVDGLLLRKISSSGEVYRGKTIEGDIQYFGSYILSPDGSKIKKITLLGRVIEISGLNGKMSFGAEARNGSVWGGTTGDIASLPEIDFEIGEIVLEKNDVNNYHYFYAGSKIFRVVEDGKSTQNGPGITIEEITDTNEGTDEVPNKKSIKGSRKKAWIEFAENNGIGENIITFGEEMMTINLVQNSGLIRLAYSHFEQPRKYSDGDSNITVEVVEKLIDFFGVHDVKPYVDILGLKMTSELGGVKKKYNRYWLEEKDKKSSERKVLQVDSQGICVVSIDDTSEACSILTK